MIKDLKDKKPKIHKNTFLADSADLMGWVTLGEDSSVWYGAVVRGDMESISIGEATNIQDNVTVHVDTDSACKIGDNVTVGHNAVVHGCEIGDNCLIGMGSVVLDHAKIGKNSIVAAGSVVTPGTVIEENSMVMGIPAKVVRKLTEEEIERNLFNARRYVDLWKNEHI